MIEYYDFETDKPTIKGEYLCRCRLNVEYYYRVLKWRDGAFWSALFEFSNVTHWAEVPKMEGDSESD